MTVYPDTSFLCSVYRLQSSSAKAAAFLGRRQSGPLPVSSLLLFEFRNSVRFQMRLFGLDRSKGYSQKEGGAMLRALEADLSGDVLKLVAPDWAEVHRMAEILSAKHTGRTGHRFADILHVATAMHLGAEEFLTFDVNQRKLAEAEGMMVPV